jgi:V8-like Glu-specific endopeptidase
MYVNIFVMIGSHSFMVAMVDKRDKSGRSFCGSSLVAVMTVVTAAHCVTGMNPNQIMVNVFFIPLYFRPNPSIKMGGTDRCGILFYAGSTTTDIGLLLVAPAPLFSPHETFSI